MKKFDVGDLVYYTAPDGSRIETEVIGLSYLGGEVRYLISGAVPPVKAESLSYVRPEREFEIGDTVLYDDGGRSPFEVEVTGFDESGKETLYFISGKMSPVSPKCLTKIEYAEQAGFSGAPSFKFKVGDIVTVRGYEGNQYTVLERAFTTFEGSNVIGYLLYPLNEPPTLWNIVDAFEEDIVLVGRGPEEIMPEDKVLKKTPATHSERETRERLRSNRRTVELIHNHIDRKLALYSITKDERYLRHAARLKQWADKVPTRAYKL
ncbi:hypothetical protein [Paludifilum halophilum]|uniref:Uncharacterized protein n=1 Tax=Paludifilum halophilum TaxID=1642702 RepID=A0A235B8M4_9BACL|nr:hypothetical protein [Paludifilum halophilum]OYD08582.1 hypothetical protein CHM34_07090 [Paludifilum halophilum]